MVAFSTSADSDTEQSIDTSHLLVVDDDADNRFLLEHMLRNTYNVSCVASGEAALDFLENTPVDMVLLDIMMPGMNGLDVLRSIREQDKMTELPVILVTALSASPDIVEGLKIGANDYITKPLDRNITMARIATQMKLKRLQDEREETIRELENAQEVRDQIFRVASHDLKNPLANIRMAEYVLRDSVADDPVAIQMMDTVAISLDAMQEVIEDFLDVVVLQSGKIDLDMHAVAVEKVIYNAVIQYNPTAESKDITINIANSDGHVRADLSRLTQVVNNLLSNAIKYSPKDSAVSIWSSTDVATVRINIADQGEGIPPGERHLLFTEFGKLSTRPTAQETSTGLGLWIVKNLAELMKGTVGADFPADGGSIFWVELPLAPATNP